MMIPEYEEINVPCNHPMCWGSILFLHGFGGSCRDYFAASLLEPYFNFYAINLPGHGSKKPGAFDADLETYVNYVVDYIKYKDLHNLTLIGHSFGGGIAALVENRIRERILNLVVISPPARSIQSVHELETVLFPQTLDAVFELCRYAYHDFEKMKNVPGFAEACQKTLEFQLEREPYLRGLYQLLVSDKTIESIEEALRKVKVWSLYARGLHDRIVPLKSTPEPALGNVNIAARPFPNSGHCPHNEEPEDFFISLYKFITINL